MNMRFLGKQAFTLAETLITLGIIGIVAVIIMGTVIPKIQDMQNAQIWKKKYSELSNIYNMTKEEIGGSICAQSQGGASRLIRDENGNPKPAPCRKLGVSHNQSALGYYYTTLSPEFVNTFVSHMKVVDQCSFYPEYGGAVKRLCSVMYYPWVGNHDQYYSYYGSLRDDSGAKYINDGRSHLTDNGTFGYDIKNKAVLQPDGTVVYFGGYATGWITVDVNGFQKGPNVIGRDVFTAMVNDDWMKPLGAEGTYKKTGVQGNNPFDSITDESKTGECKCSKDWGASGMTQGFLGNSDLLNGTMVSGGCCSYTKLYNK